MLKEQLRKLACEEENKTIIITYLLHRPVFLNCSSKIINYTVGVLTATISAVSYTHLTLPTICSV